MRRIFRFSLATLATILLVVSLVLGGFRANAWFQESQTAEQLSPANGTFIETEMGRMHVTEWGKDNATPIVMTHGMAAWGGLWEETGKFLGQRGYRVIAVDQPPFGFSERKNTDFSRSRQAARIAALVKSLDVKDYVLLGHSYGGGVALETALRYPEEIAALVLVCPVIGLRGNAVNLKANEPHFLLRSQFMAEWLTSATITNPLMTGFLTKRFMHRKDALTERHVQILQRPIRLQGNTANMVLWLRQFLAGDLNAKSRNRADLAELSIPVSLIWGENDTVTPIQQGEILTEILEPVSFARMSDTGHMPQLERPGQFNDHLVTVLDKLQQTLAQKKMSNELRTSIDR